MSLKAVVLDIEGTTSSSSYVFETLYPYSRERFRPWITTNSNRLDVQEQIEAVRRLANEPEADLDRVCWWLDHWLGSDEKVTPLKAFQGWIWSEGFAAGDLTSHFFDDAIPAMRAWHASGLQLSIFSSGSVTAQHAWFGNSPDGDLLSLFQHHFDTENIGPKKHPASYEAIANAIGMEPQAIVFLSDLSLELDAARNAGWHTIGVRRRGDQYFEQGVGDHAEIYSFEEVDFLSEPPFVGLTC
jgi:enolase-phosphatase E1